MADKPPSTAQSNATVVGRQFASLIAGWVLTRLLKSAWISGGEYEMLVALLPTVLFNIWIGIRTRSQLWAKIKLVANMEKRVTIEELHELERQVKAGDLLVPNMPTKSRKVKMFEEPDLLDEGFEMPNRPPPPDQDESLDPGK